MERDAARDRGLAVRMTLAVAGMALVWAAILGVLAIFVVAGIAERSGWSLGAGLLGLGAIPLLLYVQYHGAGQAAVRILRAKAIRSASRSYRCSPDSPLRRTSRLRSCWSHTPAPRMRSQRSVPASARPSS
ncbi:MAG TPA: hypothetical protein VHC45_11755 [Gaiellaceae bacterium]|nr:hypothetical protein [Gaiellaceae bacterium]